MLGGIVKPEGRKDSPFVLVGEAPGATEVQKGRPFCGPAGKVLDRCLRAAGIPRASCYLTNTFPYPIEVKDHLKFTRTDVWESEDLLQCRDMLISSLRECSAKVVVVLGQTALWALCREQHITKWRGSMIRIPELPGVTIVPTIHPAATFHNPLEEYNIILDLKKACKAEEGTLKVRERTLIVEPSFLEIMDYIRACKEHDRVAFDIEVLKTENDYEISCFSLSYHPDHAISIPLVDLHKDNYLSFQQEFRMWRELEGLMDDRSIEKVLQNASFDNSFMLRKHNIYAWPVQDTMIAQGIIAPGFPKGLDYLCSIYTTEPYYKDEGKKHMKANVLSHSFWEYSAKDSAVLLDIFPQQEEEMKRFGVWDVYRMHVDCLEPALFLQTRGMKLDSEVIKSASDAIEREVDEKTRELCRVAGKEINPGSPQQVKNYFYIEKGLKPYTKKGKATVDEDALKRIALKGFQEAWIMLEIRKLRKLKSSYLDMKLDDDNRLRCSMNVIGTVTGRFSTSKTIFDTGGNIQNLPTVYKRFICADEDYLIYEMDLSQAENRVVAYIAPEPRMISVFEENKDIHSMTGAAIASAYLGTHIPVEQIKEEHKKGVGAPLGDGSKPWRFWGKTANHSLNYGIGPNKFALNAEITAKDAKVVIDVYYKLYPGVKQYHEWVRYKLSEDRILINPFGRKRTFFGRWDDELFRKAYDYIPQSTVAHVINEWGILPVYNNQETFRPLELLNQVHDSIIFQIPLAYDSEEHANCILALQDSLAQPITWKMHTFSIPVECKVGVRLADQEDLPLYSKEALVAKLEDIRRSLDEKTGELA